MRNLILLAIFASILFNAYSCGFKTAPKPPAPEEVAPKQNGETVVYVDADTA